MNIPILSTSEEHIAPWNQKKCPFKKEKVTVSITISKTMEINVEPDEEITEIDEDGTTNTYSTYDDNTLDNAVLQSGKLPDLNGWNLDDIAVILE